MRFIKKEAQTPMPLVPREKRKSFFFILLLVGIAVFAASVLVFISSFFLRDFIQNQWNTDPHVVQTRSVFIAAAGVFIYIGCALQLYIPLRKTNFYKLKTIIRDEPYDPPVRGDATRAIFPRLSGLNDQWAYFAGVKPKGTVFKIQQVIIGPGGMYSTHPIAENPARHSFDDPGKTFDQASRALSKTIGLPVQPIILFPSPRFARAYRKKHAPETEVMTSREIYAYLNAKEETLSAKQIKDAEALIHSLIDGTAPGN